MCCPITIWPICFNCVCIWLEIIWKKPCPYDGTGDFEGHFLLGPWLAIIKSYSPTNNLWTDLTLALQTLSVRDSWPPFQDLFCGAGVVHLQRVPLSNCRFVPASKSQLLQTFMAWCPSFSKGLQDDFSPWQHLTLQPQITPGTSKSLP